VLSRKRRKIALHKIAPAELVRVKFLLQSVWVLERTFLFSLEKTAELGLGYGMTSCFKRNLTPSRVF